MASADVRAIPTHPDVGRPRDTTRRWSRSTDHRGEAARRYRNARHSGAGATIRVPSCGAAFHRSKHGHRACAVGRPRSASAGTKPSKSHGPEKARAAGDEDGRQAHWSTDHWLSPDGVDADPWARISMRSFPARSASRSNVSFWSCKGSPFCVRREFRGSILRSGNDAGARRVIFWYQWSENICR